MARIALIAGLALAGAFVSVATGGLGSFAVGAWATDIIAGAAVGASIGNVLSSIIFPPHVNSAPPMNDLQSMSSAYGSPICWGYGGYRIGGQVIAAQTIKVHKNKQKTGGKGGGPTSTVYTYTINAAISFGFGPGSIVRIWADSKLIYDKSGKGPVAIDTGLSTQNGNAITTPFVPKFYNGTSTQLPDPTLQGIFGINVVSGYRDQIYMVLTNFPLADFGNRLPNFRAEITSSTGLSYIKDLYPESQLAGHGGLLPPTFTHVDPVNRAGFTLNSSGEVIQKIDLDVTSGTPANAWAHSTAYVKGDQVLDINGNIQFCIRNHTSQSSGQPSWQTGEMQITQVSSLNTWQNEGPGPDVVPIVAEHILTWPNMDVFVLTVAEMGFASGPDTAGNFWVQTYRGSGAPQGAGFYMSRFNSQTFVNDKQIFTSALGGPSVIYSFTKMKSSETGKNYLYAVGKEANTIWVIDAGAGQVVNAGTWSYPGSNMGVAAAGFSPPAIDPATGIAYLLLKISDGVTGIIAVDLRSGASQTLWANSFGYAAFGGNVHDLGSGLYWDASDSTLIMTSDQGAVAKLKSSDGSIIASAPAGTLENTGGNVSEMQARAYDCLVPSTGILGLLGPPSAGTHTLVYLQTSDLSIVQTQVLTNWLPAIAGHTFTWMAYDVLTNSILATATASGYANFTTRIFLDRQAVAEESLQSVVEDIWARTGADPAFLDASALSGLFVKGYPITQQSTGKGLLGPLQAAFFFDMVETDNVLKAVLRGQSVTTVIPEDDLGILSDNYEAVPTVVQEHDLPIFINVNYYDKARDYQMGKQTYRRSKRVRKTRNKTEINLPMTLAADEAAAISARCLQTAWAERNQWEFKLWKSKYLTIDPTDVVEFTYNGKVYQSRIGKTSVGANKVIEITAVSEDPRQYSSSPVGSAGNGFNSGTISAVLPSAFFILDTPFFTDGDQNPGNTTGFYWAMTPSVVSSNWPGGILYDSSDNNIFEVVNIDTSEVTYGFVAAATPAPKTLWSLDRTTVVNVVISNGLPLTSCTLLQMLNGSNRFFLGGEQMAFANATLQTNGSYNLDTLLRGLRGTEGFCDHHAAAETFVLLDTTMQRQVQPTSVINAVQYFRGITLGQPVTSGASTPTTLVGNDLKPYAPAQFVGVKSGGSDMAISWQRRTRIGGAWLDGTGTVPLSEEFESYDLDIMQLNLQQRAADPTYFTTPATNLVKTSFESGVFYQTVSPFTITWEDGVTASYAGKRTTVGLEAQSNPWFFWVYDPFRLGEVGAVYGDDAPAFADDTSANLAGHYLIGVIPAFLAGQIVSYYQSGDGGDFAVRTVNVNVPNYTYTSAQQVADFGRNEFTGTGAPGFVRANLYQNSAAIGRGFAATSLRLGNGVPVSGGSDPTGVGVSITGTADGDVLQYNSGADEWQIVGPLLKRQALTKTTTASLANNASETGTFSIGCGTFAMLVIAVDRAARVQLYSTAALRDADAGRAYNTPPADGTQNGVIADFELTAGGAETWTCSPPLVGANADVAPADQIYYRITNLSGGTHTVSSTITIVPLVKILA